MPADASVMHVVYQDAQVYPDFMVALLTHTHAHVQSHGVCVCPNRTLCWAIEPVLMCSMLCKLKLMLQVKSRYPSRNVINIIVLHARYTKRGHERPVSRRFQHKRLNKGHAQPQKRRKCRIAIRDKYIYLAHKFGICILENALLWCYCLFPRLRVARHFMQGHGILRRRNCLKKNLLHSKCEPCMNATKNTCHVSIQTSCDQ